MNHDLLLGVSSPEELGSSHGLNNQLFWDELSKQMGITYTFTCADVHRAVVARPLVQKRLYLAQ